MDAGVKQERSNPRSKRSRECPLRYSELISCKVRPRPHSLSDYINSERLRASFVWTRDGDLITVSYATLASAGRRDGGAQAREKQHFIEVAHSTRFPPCRHSIDKDHLLNPFTASACTLSGLKSAPIHAYKQYIWSSCKKSAVSTVHFDRSPLTCSCERRKKP